MLLVAAAVVGGMLCRASAQGPPPFQFLTAEELTAVVGTESAASAIVSEALTYRVGNSSSKKATTVPGSEIPENWLPHVSGVVFERLSDDAIQAHLKACGWVLYIHSFKRVDPDTVSITVAERNECESSGVTLTFKRSPDGWHQDTSGVGGGFVSGAGHCACR
jgi:hypothetical protein